MASSRPEYITRDGDVYMHRGDGIYSNDDRGNLPDYLITMLLNEESYPGCEVFRTESVSTCGDISPKSGDDFNENVQLM